MRFHLGRGGPETRDAAEKQLAALAPGEPLYLHAEKADNGKHTFVAIATTLDGFHSGKRRYLVGCCTCAALLHEATTGPLSHIVEHLHEVTSGPIEHLRNA